MPTPAKNEDLHGNVPDEAHAALLLIDVINDFEFEGGEDLIRYAEPAARKIAGLIKRARRANIPLIYVNDNFGKWQSDFKKLIEHCLRDEVRGKKVVELLKPGEDDYFVLKPKHSGFYSTTLDTLLLYLKVRTLILAGVAGNICVLFTANDAFLRDYHLFVPSDCVASNHSEDNDYALRQMEQVLKADIRPSDELDLERINSSDFAPANA
ncbi:MAG TPA: isochorismatase family cysteine hydrolase [Blastocatellia bacterium]|jgi:nicotinamidase-related amidase|nr:isochorismatase family cysteine hydrolase [Blastocatellia bacterium]